MSRLVTINLGYGNLQDGCADITARIFSHSKSPRETDNNIVQRHGSLPSAPNIEEQYRRWELVYRAFYETSGFLSIRTIQVEEGGLTNISVTQFNELSQQLGKSLNHWLTSASFSTIHNELCSTLNCGDEILLIIETNNQMLRRLPWHLWNFFSVFENAEVAISNLGYRRIKSKSKTVDGKARVLAIFGSSDGLDLQAEPKLIENIPNAEPFLLKSPNRQQLNEHLWDDRGWDILFFAGHSQTENEAGRIYLNQTDSITIDELRNALRQAIANGLKLAIFNSCDGLGLAINLADLYIPQVIVMRDLVPDVVAQKFFRDFSSAYSGGKSLYLSVREARAKLQGLEGDYPCATWLPVICQNPTAVAVSWQDLIHDNSENSSQLSLVSVMLVSIFVITLVIGLRLLGLMQPWELKAYDHLMRLQPDEKQDDRLLVVTIDEEDFQLPEQKSRIGARSLSDLALGRLLDKLNQFEPQAIGLDIYHPDPLVSEQSALAANLQENNFFAICTAGETNQSGIASFPELSAEQLGFSDIIKDSDGVLRRHLLAMQTESTSSCAAHSALSLQLALHYLKQKHNIEGQYNSRTGNLEIAKTVFKRLPAPIANDTGNILKEFWRSRRGGYQAVDPWGYQILLNYRSHHRSPETIAHTVTLTEVLQGQLNPELVKDRIVLIGVTARSAGDFLATPYSARDAHQLMPGVMAQAQMTSQILNAVLDQRPLISVLPFWGELLWIGGWSIAGGIISWGIKGKSHLVFIATTAMGILYFSCWSLLLQGVWIPLVPSAIAFLLTGGSVKLIYSAQQNSEQSKLIPINHE